MTPAQRCALVCGSGQMRDVPRSAITASVIEPDLALVVVRASDPFLPIQYRLCIVSKATRSVCELLQRRTTVPSIGVARCYPGA